MSRSFLLGVRWRVGTGKRISGGNNESVFVKSFVVIFFRVKFKSIGAKLT